MSQTIKNDAILGIFVKVCNIIALERVYICIENKTNH